MNDLNPRILKKVQKALTGKANVIGFSNQLMPRQLRDGTFTGELCIRVYVSKKELDLTKLSLNDLVPRTLSLRNFLRKTDYVTDVVEIGEIKALVDKTVKFRPVELGVSVGHYNITAGSLGMYYMKDGKVLPGSNAHVTTPDPSLTPAQITEKRICQPGPAHDSNKAANVVGTYSWHKQIYPDGTPSGCRVTNWICDFFNLLLAIRGAKTRIEAIVQVQNHIDFGVYEKTTAHIFEMADGSINPEVAKFIGHLFAGSAQSGIICKSKYIEAEGYIPMGPGSVEPKAGDRVKGSSFWCNYETYVTDPSATITVNYGNFNAIFYDVIVVFNENVIKGGWSGSGWFPA